jgi:hypothetical protein
MEGILIDWWFDHDMKNLCVRNFKRIRERNRKEYGDDPEINNKRQWGIHTNGARKGDPQHTCFDWSLDIGHICINYTDFDYNRKYR